MASKEKAQRVERVRPKRRRSRAADEERDPLAHPLDSPSLVQRALRDPGSLVARDVQELQDTIGNRAVSRLLARGVLGRAAAQQGHGQSAASATGGLSPEVTEERQDQVVGGRTFGELLGDIGRPIGTTLGNLVGDVAGALTGINISSSSNSGPTWNPHGHFDWRVGFNTTGKSGWIVQEIVNTYRAVDATGNDVTPVYTPHYWEAWAVDAAGTVTPSVGANNDYWIRPSRGASTEGHWSMSASVYFTTTDPATQGFSGGGVKDAGILLSTTSAPTGLGVARLHRYAQGAWDSTGTTPTHTGSAGP